MGIQGTYLNIIKAIYDKHRANIILNDEKMKESLSSKLRNKTRMPIFNTSIQHSIGSPIHNNQTRKINKRCLIVREEVKHLLFVEDMILYTESPKVSNQKILE